MLNVIPGEGLTIGESLCSHPDVDGVFFTGSYKTGQLISKYASNSTPKKVSLELGGKSSLIVFKGYKNIKKAVKTVLDSIFINNGQTCNAITRVIIHDSVYNEFMSKMIGAMKGYTPSDPLNPLTKVGAIASSSQYEKIKEYINLALKSNLKILYSVDSSELSSKGYYISPYIIFSKDFKDELSQSEIFGPILLVTKFNSDAEAIKLANNTKYNLASGLFTLDLEQAFFVSNKLLATNVYINGWGLDGIQVPFGGYGYSGNSSIDKSEGALKLYSRTKTISINYS